MHIFAVIADIGGRAILFRIGYIQVMFICVVCISPHIVRLVYFEFYSKHFQNRIEGSEICSETRSTPT